jgi:fatty-acyl-CoA synthase
VVVSSRSTSLACVLWYTGSPAAPRLLADAIAQLGPVVWRGYGQSESGMISLLTPEHIGRFTASLLSRSGRCCHTSKSASAIRPARP